MFIVPHNLLTAISDLLIPSLSIKKAMSSNELLSTHCLKVYEVYRPEILKGNPKCIFFTCHFY